MVTLVVTIPIPSFLFNSRFRFLGDSLGPATLTAASACAVLALLSPSHFTLQLFLEARAATATALLLH